MKPPRRSTRSNKSMDEWMLEDKHWTSESKRLRKSVKTTKKTCQGQDLPKRDIACIGGAGYKSNTEGRSPIISDGKSVGYPSSTDSHSITVKVHIADGNCENMNKRNVIKEKTQFKTSLTAESTDMIVEKRKKAGENGNIVKLKKAGKNKTDIDINPNMATWKKLKRQNEDSNIINSESHYKDDDSLDDILNHEFSVTICPSLEDGKLKQRQESEPFVGENGAVTERTKRQCVPLTIQDSSGNTLKANNPSLGPSTDDTSLLSNENEFLNNETIKDEVSVESNPVCSPVIPTVADFKRPFHGWSTEPRCGMPWVEQDYSRYDMHTPSTLNPILTISMGCGKKAKSPGEKVKRPSKVSTESDEGPSPSKTSKLEKKMEQQAMKKFQQAREQVEKRGDLVAGTKNTVELLKPSCHLTGACWKTFLRHVHSFDGWVAKRREATAEEKKKHKETRKGKVYFVDVVFNVPKEKQALKRSVEAAQGSSKAGSSGIVFGSGGDADTSSEDTRELRKKEVSLGKMKDEFLNNETIKEEILDDDEVQIVGCLQLTPMISVKTEVETERGEPDMPSATPSFQPHSTDDFSFQPRQNVTVDRPRPSVIIEMPRDIISRDGPHDHDTIGMDVPHHSIGMDHDYAKIAYQPPNVTGVGSASGRVYTPKRNLTVETPEAREAVHSQEGAQLGGAREREHRAGLEVVGPSVGVDDQVAGGGTGGSRSEGVNHSVEIQAPAQGGNRGARVYGGAWRGNDKMKIKVEIELSTAQFIQVAHVLPTLGSAANAE